MPKLPPTTVPNPLTVIPRGPRVVPGIGPLDPNSGIIPSRITGPQQYPMAWTDPATEFLRAHPNGILPPKLSIDPKSLDPIHLTATVTIQPGTNGGVNTISLQNPLGLPMELLEIKWMVSSDPGVTVNGGAIECALNLASIPVSQGFVPIWNYGPCRNEIQEQVDVLADQVYYPIYDWKLKHPLFIPGGACLQPTFKHRGLVQYPITVRIDYSCRTLPRNYIPPKKIKIPYVSGWVAKAFQMIGDDATDIDTDVSQETDINNRWDHPVQVHEWTGRCDFFITSDETHNETNENGSGRIGVQIKDSRGEVTVGRILPVPFRTLFSRVTRSWEVDYPMPAHLWYRVQLTRTPLVLAPGSVRDGLLGTLLQPMMALIGTHEMDRGGIK